MINLTKPHRLYLRPKLNESYFFRKIFKIDKHFIELPESANKSLCTPVLVERFSSEAITESPSYTSVFWIDFHKEIGPSVLDLLNYIRENIDSSLAFRQNCRDGSCGMCSMNINGRNTLACISPTTPEEQMIIRPLTRYPVIHDLIVDKTEFYFNMSLVKPWLVSSSPNTQSPESRSILDSVLPCNLCGCCNASSFDFWWNKEVYLGPAALLQAYRWVQDSRDQVRAQRLLDLQELGQLNAFKSEPSSGRCPIGLDVEGVVTSMAEEMKKSKENLDSWAEWRAVDR